MTIEGQPNGGVTSPTEPSPAGSGGQSGDGDVLANLQLSEEAKKQLEANQELLGVITHNLEAKRNANAEAKKNREELESIRAQQAEAQKEKLKQQGEFKKLYEQAQAQLAEKDAKIQQATINNKVSLLASQKGIKKASYLRMFDTTSLTVDDNFDVPGLEESFNKFVAENPDLFGSNGGQGEPGAPATPSTDGGQPNLGSGASAAIQLKELETAAKTGDIRSIARLREFKKKHGLMQNRNLQ